MAGLLQDVRYSFRQLHKSPGFTAVTLLTLALGIGANTAIFGVINGILLKPLPFSDSERLASLRARLDAALTLTEASYRGQNAWQSMQLADP